MKRKKKIRANKLKVGESMEIKPTRKCSLVYTTATYMIDISPR
jgi:hypothetical protein